MYTHTLTHTHTHTITHKHTQTHTHTYTHTYIHTRTHTPDDSAAGAEEAQGSWDAADHQCLVDGTGRVEFALNSSTATFGHEQPPVFHRDVPYCCR